MENAQDIVEIMIKICRYCWNEQGIPDYLINDWILLVGLVLWLRICEWVDQFEFVEIENKKKFEQKGVFVFGIWIIWKNSKKYKEIHL